MKRKIKTQIIVLDTQEKLIDAMIKVGNQLAAYDEERWAPCPSPEVIEWRACVEAYKALKKIK